ncbi:hypothetical protein [Actinomadura rifamycini]|uniref:hypothetical protein n=1 Tax=Actinomadura rifamycini TaxID=31962 RepID=UPI0004238F0C|nr:hypothetical protein [Actinomadura rifamycini]
MPRGVFERGEKPPSPYERLSETELREAAGSELDALRAQAAECLEPAEAIGRAGTDRGTRAGPAAASASRRSSCDLGGRHRRH